MKSGLSRRDLGRATLAGVSSFAILRHARGEEALKIRCSLDTAPSHVRNISIVDYLKQVETATSGKITSEVFHSGQLYADINVGKALLQGQVDMAAPGGWTQTGIVSDCDFVQLPDLYGQTIEVNHAATDGKAGAHVASQLETKLRVKTLGQWIDLGFQNWYSTKKPLQTVADLKGLKIRSPGGVGISWRITLFGGIANTTAWPNVPLALSQGTFDAFVSTDESLKSAKLWEAGVKYSYADHQYVGQYIPMVSQAFWAKLSPEEQKLMLDLWAKNIPTYRVNAAAAQTDARKLLMEKGVTFADPSREELAANRKLERTDVDTLIKDAKLSPEIVRLTNEATGGAA
jgi:TRAP-type C4-dicarboxylate transport system substrate-binding protein